MTSFCRSERGSAFFLHMMRVFIHKNRSHSQVKEDIPDRDDEMRIKLLPAIPILLAKESMPTFVETLFSACLKLFHFRDLLLLST